MQGRIAIHTGHQERKLKRCQEIISLVFLYKHDIAGTGP